MSAPAGPQAGSGSPSGGSHGGGDLQPPPLVLVNVLDGVEINGSKAAAQFVVEGKPGDDGEFEFVAAVRVPSLDLVKETEKPLFATLRKDVHVLSTRITARGGTPLVDQLVEIVDPDSHEPVGPPVRTDENGQLLAEVPEDKPYDIRILDDDEPDPIESPLERSPVDESQEERPVLAVRLLDESGAPLANERYEAKGPMGSFSGITDAEGDVEVDGVESGAYEITIRGKTLKAHTLYSTDLEQDGEPYRLVVR